jgi:hypothetical protein
MSSQTIFLISAGCIFGGALVGLLLHGLLPERHLRDASKDTVKVSGAIFVILEMSHPLDGIIKVSSAPMRKALEHLGQ